MKKRIINIMLFAHPRDVSALRLVFAAFRLPNVKTKTKKQFLRNLPRIMRMPITMMQVMTAIFETFVRSGSPLSKAVRALGSSG